LDFQGVNGRSYLHLANLIETFLSILRLTSQRSL